MTRNDDYSRRSGGAAVGAMLRRLSERIDADAARVYADRRIAFEQRWFGPLNQLALYGPMSVGDLAAALRITHASVSQTRQSLEKAGLVASLTDPADGRRRTLTLTSAGRALVEDLTPLWRAFNEAALELDAEAGGAAEALGRLADALEHEPLYDRIMRRLR